MSDCKFITANLKARDLFPVTELCTRNTWKIKAKAISGREQGQGEKGQVRAWEEDTVAHLPADFSTLQQ